jgi:acetolactate synthase small subunit
MVVSTPQPAAGIDPSANDECVSDSQEKCGPSIKHDDTDAVPKVQPTTLTDEHEDDTQISDVEVVQSPGTTESRNEHHERMARSSQDRTPEPVLRLVSQQGEPSRITKKPRQTRSQKSILSSILRSNTRPGYAGVASIDPMLDSIRSAFYTESKRIDEFHAAQMKAQSDNIAALQGTINLQNNCINVLQAEKKKLRAKAKDQIDKSNRYIKGIQNDYNKLKETAKVHQQECSTVLEREVAEIQKEKALMERDFRVTLDAMEKSQKSTKNALDELFYSLKLSEARKRDLMVILTSKDQLLEDEKAKRVQLEEQVLFSIHSLQQLLLDNNGDLLEEMSQIQASLDASRVDEKRDVCIQECLEALQVFQKTSIVRVEDVKKAEGMLRFLNER